MAAYEGDVEVGNQTVVQLTDSAITSDFHVCHLGGRPLRIKAVASGGSAPTTQAGFAGGMKISEGMALDFADLSAAFTPETVYAWCETGSAKVAVSHD